MYKLEERTTGRRRWIGRMEDWKRLTDERKEGLKMMKDEKERRKEWNGRGCWLKGRRIGSRL